jgi:beta-galactosidase
MLLGTCYYPEQRDPSDWDDDLKAMRGLGMNAIRVGEFAWARYEPTEGNYDFDWMDTFLGKAAARELSVVLGVPLRTAPAWLVAIHPEVLAVRADGLRYTFGSRYTFCPTHTALRERSRLLAQALATRYKEHATVIGWHLDNELGDDTDCHCDLCASSFRRWLEETYHSIDELNRAWGTAFWGITFSSFDQVPTPRLTYRAGHNPGLLQAWRRFVSQTTIGQAVLLGETVRAHRRDDQWISTNHQSLWNARTDYYAMSGTLDVCGTNYYPPYGEDLRTIELGLAACRGYKKNKGFHLFELRAGSFPEPGRPDNTPTTRDIERLALHATAAGAQSLFYFRWKLCPYGAEQTWSAVTSYDGSPHRFHEAYRQTIGRLNRIASILQDTEVHSRVALFYDFPTRWVYENDDNAWWHGPRELYLDRAKMLHRVVRNLGYNCDVVGRRSDWSRYRVLLVPMLTAINDELVSGIARWVEAGGVLVWHPLSGCHNEEVTAFAGRLHPCLQELLGVSLTDYATSGPSQTRAFTWGGMLYDGRLFHDLPRVENAQVLARYAEGSISGEAALVRAARGKGSAVTVMTFPEEAFYRDFLSEALPAAGVDPILPSPPPPGVEFAERRDRRRRLVFVLNASERVRTITVPGGGEDIWNQEQCGEQLRLSPHASRVLLQEIESDV